MAYFDKYGVEFSDDRKTLLDCPTDFQGEYVIPDGVICIGGGFLYDGFRGCSRLTSVKIPNGVTRIEGSAFYGCTNLTTIMIPDSVTSIGSCAFSGCSSLTSVSIGKSVTSIEEHAFDGCCSLVSFCVDKGNTFYSSKDGILFDKQQSTLIKCPEFKQGEYVVSNRVTSIGDRAFEECKNLTSVMIPHCVTSIGNDAFIGCKKIISPIYNDSVFAFLPTSYMGEYVIPPGIKRIAGGAFNGCSKLTSVEIPNSVTSIGLRAFSGCISLPVIDNLRYADAYLVEAVDKSLSKYKIKDGTRWIGDMAFSSCNSLSSVVIPKGVTNIGYAAFWHCFSLHSVKIPNSVTSIGEYAFSNCTKLTSVKIPNSVTCIGIGAFSSCRGLTSVTIPNSVTSIGDYAFSGCSSLTSVTIPDGVTSIGYSAFSGCSSLNSVTIPNSVTGIGDYAFEKCISLTSVTIPNSVTGIGWRAFYGCDNFANIYVPKGQKERFAQMEGLKDIKHLIVEKADVALNDRFTIRKLLYNNKITCFYHFTSRKNIDSVCKHGGLYSWLYLKTHQIDIPLQGGGELSQGLDRYKGVADYVHLSFCENHPMAYHLIQEGEDIVVLKISTDVALLDGTMFTDMNAVDSQCSCAAGLEGLQKVNIAATKEKYLSSDNPLFKYKQAEILVKTHIPLEYILNIDEFL